MLAGLALAGASLRLGLRMRGRRQRGERPEPGLLRRHLRVAKPAVAMIAVGFAAGPVSAVWLRGWEPFATSHAWLGLACLLLFLATALLGRRLERGDRRPLDAHGLLGALSLFAAAIAAVAGFTLLP
jgi:membrane protein implicated in regulation of membrane protease activity